MGSKTVWIIVDGRGSPYTGAHFIRSMIIADHVNAYDKTCFDARRSGYGGLSDDQRRAWAECRKRGDRAVKATLAWDVGGGA